MLSQNDVIVNYDDIIHNFGDSTFGDNKLFDWLHADYQIWSPYTDVEAAANNKFHCFARSVHQDLVPVFQEFAQQFSKLFRKSPND